MLESTADFKTTSAELFYSTRLYTNMAAKRKAVAMAAVDEEPVDPADELMFLNLGGGCEVGRSCHIVQYKGKTVMVSYQLPLYKPITDLSFLLARCWPARWV